MADLATIIIHDRSLGVSVDEGDGLVEFLNKLSAPQPGKRTAGAPGTSLPPDYTISFVIGRFRYTYAAGRWSRTLA